MEKLEYRTYPPEGKGSEDMEPLEEDPRNKPFMVQQKQCRMCLQYFYQGEEVMKIPNCDHIFHDHCLRKWLLEWQRCPSCDRNIIHMPSDQKAKYQSAFAVQQVPSRFSSEAGD